MTGRSAPLVVVTRAGDQAGELSDRLRAVGYGVVEVPVIAIVEPDDAGAALASSLARLGEFDWLVVTSANGAQRVAAALAALTTEQRPRVAAVGPATARALGVEADLVATTSIGEGLVEVFAEGHGSVLVVQAHEARPVVVAGLRSKGWQVESVVAYRTVPAPVGDAARRQVAEADAVLFTSGSTVRHFVAALGSASLPRVVVSIGPATTAVARQVGVSVTATASVHSLDGLIEALGTVLGPSTL
jgi:uroporphyrinogen-III synthase